MNQRAQRGRVTMRRALGSNRAPAGRATRFTLVPNRGAPNAHCRCPVRERMVDAPHQRASATAQRRQQIDSPQRLGPIQTLRKDLADLRLQCLPVKLAGRGLDDVLLQTDLGHRHPRWNSVNLPQTQAKLRSISQASGD